MQEIGRIKAVQVQRTALKVGHKPQRYYDPTALLVVDRLLVSSQGAIGVTADGSQVIDVHHVDHPASRNARVNGVSVGFSSHYEAMRDRFGPHVADGCAGENILLEVDRSFTLADLEQGLAIQAQDSGLMVYLTDVMVAAPCVEFTQFAANHGMPLPAEELKAALQFLDHGRRGFYVTVSGAQEPVAVREGDRVFVVSTPHTGPRYSSPA